MNDSTHVLVIDGGGTKTAAALWTTAGERLASCRAGPANLYRKPAAGLAAITHAWLELCAAAGVAPEAIAGSTVISAGLAGVSGAPQRRAFAAAFPGFAARRLSNDGYTAFLGVFATDPGALLSIGTGIVAYGSAPGEAPKVRSGWGFPVADRGSGAWLGFRLATEYLDRLDGAAAVPESTLWQTAAATVGTEREAILAWLKDAPAASFAAMAPAVVAAAGTGDPLGVSLLDEGATHLLRLARALKPGNSAPLCLGGGLAPVYRPYFEAVFGDVLLPATQQTDPLHGAWLIATGRVPAEYPDVI